MSIKFCMVLRTKFSPFLMITIINLYEIAIKPEINKEKQRNSFQSDNCIDRGYGEKFCG